MNNVIVGHDDVDPNALKPHPMNWREHGDGQISAMDEIVEHYGYADSVTVNKRTGFIINGHMRVQIAIERGWSTIPVEYIDVDNDTELALLTYFDPISSLYEKNNNKIKELTDAFDAKTERLKALAASLESDYFMGDRGEIMEGQESVREDAREDAMERFPVEEGDIYRVGSHVLLCGDNTVSSTWDNITQPVSLCVTSPPYWIGKDYEEEDNEADIQSHIMTVADNIANCVHESRRIVINVGPTMFTHIAGRPDVRLNIDWWQQALKHAGWNIRHIKIWAKHGQVQSNPMNDLSDMHWEFLATFYNPEAEYRGQNRVSQPWAVVGLWDELGKPSQDKHTAPFPVELPKRFIYLYTDPGEWVIDPYMGSGTTMLACENTGRKCVGIEKIPAHCALILSRMEDEGLEISKHETTKHAELVGEDG